MPESSDVLVQATNAAFSVAILGLAALLAVAAYLLTMRAIFRLGRSDRFAEAAYARCRWPARVSAVLLGVLAGVPFTRLPAGVTELLTHGVRVAAIIAAAVTLQRLAVAVEVSVLSGLDIDGEDNSWARGRTTRAILLRRVSTALIIMVAIGGVLLTFETARSIGTSLLASAGIFGLVAGIAAQSTLGNIVAGIQIAVSQPIRIDDVVVVEGEWGNVEVLSLTYVIVRTWDRRRIVLPTSYFISTPIQNWSMYSTQVIGTILWDLDHRTPVGAMRAEFHRQTEAHPLWDGDVVVLQMVDSTGPRVRVRGLVTAATAHAAWDLRCALREGLVEWLARVHPEALPSTRLLEATPGPPPTPVVEPLPPLATVKPNRSPGPYTVPNPDPERTGQWPTTPAGL